MTSTQTRLRARSLSESDHSGRPRPAKPGGPDASGIEANKRAGLPRAASAMNMRGIANITTDDQECDDPERAFRDIAREQVDRETLRALAQFFRSTGPPTGSHPPSVQNCFGVSGGGIDKDKRWSKFSLKKGSSKGRLRPTSLHLGEHTVLRTTSAGHTYMAISIPAAYAAREKRNTLAPRKRHTLNSSQSAGDLQRPTSQSTIGEEDQNGQSVLKNGDLGVVVSRAASWHDRDSFTLSIRVSTAERGVRTFLSLVDEWLEDQNTDQDHQISHKEMRIKGSDQSGHTANPRASTQKRSRIVEEEVEDEDIGNPSIALSSPSTVKEAPSAKTEPPTTPPSTGSHETSFLNLDRASFPRAADTQDAPSHIASKASSVLGLSENVKGSPRSSKSPKSQKKPSSLNVKSRLQVPETSIIPESPGFPKMLASMEFPSPPESLRSHSASNSVSSGGMSPPPLGQGHASTTTLPTNLDSRVMQLSRPTLRHHKSDGIAQASAVRRSTMSSARGSGMGSRDASSSRASRPYHYDTPAEASRDQSSTRGRNPRSRSRASMDSQSFVSTVDSSFQSTAISDNPRYSLRSDTSMASDATATTEAYGKDRQDPRDSADSATLGTDAGREHRRSETPASLRSVSSTGTTATTATAASLRERRMARRAKIREKVQRDIDANRANQLASPNSATAKTDSVDSPVLGWFPQHTPGGSRKTTAQGPSRLAQQQVPSPVNSAQPSPTFGGPLRSPARDITQLIPETVDETASPVTPTAPTSSGSCTFTPIMTVAEEPGEPTSPGLTITPIMVVANIDNTDTPPQSSSLRPLSLLSTGSIPPHPPSRSSLRPDNRTSSWQRPFPVRVSKNQLDLTVNTNTKSKRGSTPHIPTPPMSPEARALSPRFSRPMSAIPSGSVRPSESDNSRQSSQSASEPSSSTDKETQWLSAHQRQTAHEWRLAALRDRMRRERLEEKDPSSDRLSRLSVVSSSEEGEEKPEDGGEAEDLKQKQKRERDHRSTLKALNANAATNIGANGKPRPSFDDLRKNLIPEVDDQGEVAMTAAEMEQRLLRTIVPLLENMNSTLQDMQKDNVGRELSMKFMDSALALTNLKNSKEESLTQSSPGLPGPRARPVSVFEPPSTTGLINGAQKHVVRRQSMS